jgi:hypothetical protein
LFQNGVMFWRADNRIIYVLYSDGSGQGFQDFWQEGQPDRAGYTPPPGLFEPVRGFGKVWRENLDGPNATIGWGLEQERASIAVVQDFNGGSMIISDRFGLYVLYLSGRWTQ